MIYKNIKLFLEKYPRDSVNYCCSNFGGIDLARNLIQSCKRLDFPIVFFALDEDSSERISDHCDVVNYYEGVAHKLNITKNLTSEYSFWSTPEFNALNWPVWEIALDILSSERSVIKLDTDIVVKQNFEENLLSRLDAQEIDFIFQEGQPNLLCAGFCAIHHESYPIIKKIFNEDYLLSRDYFNICDQKILRSLVDENIINIELLNRDEYPNGEWFYNHYKEIIDTCKIIHFNSIAAGKQAKIKKMIKHDCWFI